MFACLHGDHFQFLWNSHKNFCPHKAELFNSELLLFNVCQGVFTTDALQQFLKQHFHCSNLKLKILYKSYMNCP